MLHACVERFDVTGIVGKNLGTKRGLKQTSRAVGGASQLHKASPKQTSGREHLFFCERVDEAFPQFCLFISLPAVDTAIHNESCAICSFIFGNF